MIRFDHGLSLATRRSIHDVASLFLVTSFYVATVLIGLFLVAELGLHLVYTVRNALVIRVPLPYVMDSQYGPVPPWVDGLRILESDADLIWKGRPRLRRTYVDIFGPADTEAERTSILRQFRPTVPNSLVDNSIWDISLNTEGFRDREFPEAKSKGTFRVVCLGDSWTFGANVGQEQTYPSQLEDRLRSRFPDRRVEVLNLGVLGYTSFQGLQLLKQRALQLEPDLVIIGFGMNDSSVSGYRDKDMTGSESSWSDWTETLRVHSQLYRLVRYIRALREWEPPTLGDAMAHEVSEAAKGQDEEFDYMSLEQWTRVSPVDYERNLSEMVYRSQAVGADVVLLFNELWHQSPYRDIAMTVAANTGVDFVDTASAVREERMRIEDVLERALGLAPPNLSAPEGDAEQVQVTFRVRVDANRAERGVFIVGADRELGALVPNRVAMRDDGTHGDQRAGDRVWSYTARVPANGEVFYVYTVAGAEFEGQWVGLDVPHVRRITVDPTVRSTRWYAPVDTFGRVYMQADGWHTNLKGYVLLVDALVKVIRP